MAKIAAKKKGPVIRIDDVPMGYINLWLKDFPKQGITSYHVSRLYATIDEANANVKNPPSEGWTWQSSYPIFGTSKVAEATPNIIPSPVTIPDTKTTMTSSTKLPVDDRRGSANDDLPKAKKLFPNFTESGNF